MSADSLWRETVRVLVIGISLLMAQVSVGQNQSTLLRLQHSKATVDIDVTGGMRGQGGNIYSMDSNPASMSTSTYPNSGSCLLIFTDGRYVLEKRYEQKVGKPKFKVAEELWAEMICNN